jgi:hypothetical protein
MGDCDAQAVFYFSQYAGLLSGAFGDRFPPLDAAIKSFDFAQAQICLNEALQALSGGTISD